MRWDIDLLTQDVLDFWCGKPDSESYGTFRPEWYKKNDAFDDSIRVRFGMAMECAGRGELNAMATTANGALALIIMLDQFSRNVHRGTPGMFATDGLALEISKQALEKGFDQDVLPVYRSFIYLPFEHSEDIAMQTKAVELFEALGNENTLKYAKAHFDIIKRFGRFPHRNKMLGRISSTEEINFLMEPGSSF